MIGIIRRNPKKNEKLNTAKVPHRDEQNTTVVW